MIDATMNFGYFIAGIAVVIAFMLCLAVRWCLKERRTHDKAELGSLRKYKAKYDLVFPELEAAIDLMYKGRIKDARTKLCRLKNTIS